MSYLSANEYLARFGEAETIRLTDEARTGDYDSGKLDEALGDSEEEVDSFLAVRYSVPLDPPPKLVRGFVGVLTRFRLHKTVVPQQVKDEADLARSQLAKLSAGTMKLPSDAGGATPEDGLPAADSATSADGPAPIFTEEALAGFGVPNGAGLARWRL